MRDMMVDLETWGQWSGVAIRSIGAVEFDPYSDKIGAEFYVNVTRESCEAAGLTVSADTAQWWDKQGDDARTLLEKDPVPLPEALKMYASFFMKCGAARTWSQGANFDQPLIEACYRAIGKTSRELPWKFWDSRCTRTAYGMAGLSFNAEKRVGVHHYALDDAKHQARCVQKSFRLLGLAK